MARSRIFSVNYDCVFCNLCTAAVSFRTVWCGRYGNYFINDISRPLVNVGNGVDVADALKIEYSYISTCLFTDCILQKIEEFKDLDENQVLKHYKEILEEKIS